MTEASAATIAAHDIDPASVATRQEHVQAIERGLAIIRAFADASQELTMADIAKAVGIPRPTARRFLTTLETLGYVQSNGRRYRLLPQVLDLGYRHFAAKPWWPDAQRVARDFADRTACPCAVAVLDGMSAVYVAYAASHDTAGPPRAIGTRLPAHASALGHILLSGLDRDDLAHRLRTADLAAFTDKTMTQPKTLTAAIGRVRAQGFAFVSGELEIGLASLGVPVPNRGGDVAAALSVSFAAADGDARIDTLFGPLRQAAQSLTNLLVC